MLFLFIILLLNVYVKKNSQSSKGMSSIEYNDKDLILNKNEKKNKSMQFNTVYQKKKIGLYK